MSKDSFTVKLLTTVAIVCLGSLQFGYHMAELNSPESIISCRDSRPDTLPYESSWFGTHGFEKCIPMSNEQVGLVTSIFSIGGLLGSFYGGAIADKFGRKRASLLHCFVYFVGSSLNGLANSYVALLLGRFIAGLGAGIALVITPVLINEISPASKKGQLGTMNQFSINVGILFTQLLALKWTTDNKWRLLLFTAAVVAVVDFLLILVYVDESPMWLFSNNRTNEAFKALHHLRGGDYAESRNEVNSWRSDENEDDQLLDNPAALEEGERTAPAPAAIGLETYLKSPEFNNSKIVATGILIFQQFCGINSIVFYGVSVLVSIFPNHAIFICCLISLVNVVVTFFSSTLVDTVGRKPLLLTSISVMGFATVLMGFGIIWASSLLSIAGTFTYITFFAIGLGPIPFLLVSEVTQPKAKASAQAWGTTMNWLATFIVGFLFPVLKNSWLGGGVYFIFTAMCGISFWFVKTQVPETKGMASYERVWRQVT